MPLFTIQLLGDFHVDDHVDDHLDNHVDYEEAPAPYVAPPRLQALIAYLLLHIDIPQARQQVASHLWPKSAEHQARNNLRRLLHDLRAYLPTPDAFLAGDDQTIVWLASAPCTADVVTFQSKIAQAQAAPTPTRAALEEAIALYRGDLLPGCYDEWITPHRERLRQLFLTSLQSLLWLAEDAHDYRNAIHHARTMLHYEPVQEQVYRRLMRLYAANGDRAAAVQTYHTCVTVLERELGVEPGPEIRAAYQRLLEMDVPATLRPQPATPLPSKIALVGRTAAWKLVQSAWTQSKQGEPHFLLISGDAGIGKTRLAEELLAWTERQGIATVHTRAYAADGRLAFRPVIEWLRSEPMQRVLSRADTGSATEVARLLPELLHVRPDLPAPTPFTEPWQRQRLFEALANLVLAYTQPLLFSIDDIQWCDSDTLAWLHYLFRFSHRQSTAPQGQAKLVIVATARLYEVEAGDGLHTLRRELRASDQITEVALEPLAAGECAQLAGLLSDRPLDAHQQQVLYTQSEGNPLFLIEAVRAGMDGNEAQRTTSRQADPSPHPAGLAPPLPSKVEAVIQQRLAQLTPQAQELAHVAATIGRSFSFHLLQQASTLEDDQIVASLDELWRRRMVREQEANRYDFSHDHIRAVAYLAISPVLRPLLHQRVARALQALHAPALDPVSGILADHYEHAGLPQEALTWHLRAAAVARRLYSLPETIARLQAARQLLDLVPDSDAATRQRFQVLAQLGDAMIAAKGWAAAEVETYLTAARQTATPALDPSDHFSVIEKLRAFYLARGEMPKALAAAQDAMALAQSAGQSELAAKAHYGYGTVYTHMGALRLGLEQYERGQAMQIGKVYTSASVGLALWLLGYPHQAVHVYAADIASAEERGDWLRLATLVFGRLIVYQLCGKQTLVATESERLLALGLQVEMPVSIHSGRILQGYAQGMDEDPDRGVELIQRGLQGLQETNHLMFRPYYLGLLAELYLRMAHFTAAASTLEQARAIAQQTGMTFWDAEIARLQGELFLATGARDGAAPAAFDKALQIARANDARSLQLRAVLSYCRLWLKTGRQADAQHLLADLSPWFTHSTDTADARAAQHLLAQLA